MANIFDVALNRWRSLTTNDLPGAGAGVAGDASAANQLTQIGLETEIRNRLPVTPHVQPLTDNQLRAAAVPVSDSTLISINTATGSQTSNPAPADGTGDYGLIAGIKRGLLNWSSLLSRLPSSLGAKSAANSLAVTLAADGAAVTAIGTPADAAAAAAGTGDYGLIAGIKRGLLNWAALLSRLPASLGGKGAAASLATVATPFEPVAGSTVSYSCSTTALAAVACTPGTVLRFGVAGSAAIGIRFGNSSAVSAAITAATAMDIMPGTAEAITVPADASHWSAIMSSGTGTLKVTLGAGS